MKAPQIVVFILTIVSVALLWLLGSPEQFSIRIIQTLAIFIGGLMVATATKIEKAK